MPGVSPVTAPRCQHNVDNLGITARVYGDRRGQLPPVHMHAHPHLDPSTLHPHPRTGFEQRRRHVIHRIHSPYYCYWEIFEVFLLEEDPWGNSTRLAFGPGSSRRCQPRGLAFKMAVDALR
jgi:hypothetical protein